MKRTIIVALSVLVTVSLQAELKITGLVDGPLTGGIPKGLELFSDINIPDLSIYGLELVSNGGGSTGQEYTFTNVSVTAGQFIYLSSEAPSFNTFFGFDSDYITSVTLFNGDDAVLLYKNGVVIDTCGDPTVDGTGTAWDYLDGWIYRKNGTGPDGGFVLDSWNMSGINALDGETSNATSATPFPIGSYVIPEPASIGFALGLLVFLIRKQG